MGAQRGTWWGHFEGCIQGSRCLAFLRAFASESPAALLCGIPQESGDKGEESAWKPEGTLKCMQLLGKHLVA